MAAFSAIAAGIGAAVAAAGTTYSIVESENAKGRAREEAAKQEEIFNKSMEEEKAAQAAQEKKQQELLDSEKAKTSFAAQKQAQKIKAAYGRSDTLLTGPLGLSSSAGQPAAGKTLLGG